MFTLLHISDLHRSSHDPIENASLLGALLADQDRYLVETPKVPKPDAAIVSGDIIQGVRLGTSNHADELSKQYDVAYEFLSSLAERFFDGDNSRVVIVPGNHDVCWNTARDAMKQLVPEDPPHAAHGELFQASSSLRWDWASRSIYEISDANAYRARLDAYWQFLERFYQGVTLKYPIDRRRGFNLFELDGGRIVVAALESVHGNDCFCRQGAIERSVLGACSLAIRDLPQQPILRLAAWHHSFQGPPHGDDYMDIAAVQEMVGNGFRLGFHGHQHQADAGAYAIHLPEELSMAISSAGSLCAGTRELPRGINREYNMVVIDDSYTSARIHVREMTQGNHFGRCGRGVFRVDGFSELSWTLPAARAGAAPLDPRNFASATVLRAETAIASGDPTAAVALLESLGSTITGHARMLFVEAAREANQTEKLIPVLQPPTNISEFVALYGAFLSADMLNDAETLLESADGFGVDAATQDSLKLKLNLKKMMGKSK
ncbi:Calcineurin-like phosphoesterase [Pseudomonas asturiensis]|uniref:Calcineurin-like phosphoesterase n=1 Tax=Pseudomonas asturiensis TaxID=1190415 RepID=A0A1M7Q1R0_9PSED|nr:Calcineurin-like phosphoesterase [Pseudomonas asturiensis]